MSNKLTISRRDFLKVLGASMAAAGIPGVAGMPSASALGRRYDSSSLKFEWWGEQEAPGLEAYLKTVIATFTKSTGISAGGSQRPNGRTEMARAKP